MVEKHIKSLLYDHDCVIIPEFGGLITRYVSARIHLVKHSLVPPSKKIAFNEKLTLNDGLLISTIAHAKGIDMQEAQRLVAEFVHKSKLALEKGNRLEMQDIGIFRYNAERKLEFEFVEGDNFLEDSFGLPELMARPVKLEDTALLRTLLKERQPVPVNTNLPLRKRLRRAVNVTAGLVITGLTISAVYLLSLQTDYNLSSLNPISLFGVHEQGADRNSLPVTPTIEEEHDAAAKQDAPEALIAELEHVEALGTEKPFDSAAVRTAMASNPEGREAIIAANKDVKDKSAHVTAIPEVKKEEPAVIKGRTGRFYVITGGYSNLKNAEWARTQVNKSGFEAKVLLPLPGRKLYRVSVADFATDEEARTSLREYRKSFGETIWVLNN